MVGCGCDFRQDDSLVLLGDDVPGRGDLHDGSIAAPFDNPRVVNLEQLGVQRAPVELKHQLGDFGANG